MNLKGSKTEKNLKDAFGDDAPFRKKQHPIIGGRILEGDDPLIRMGREIALTHHERWDGGGYPNGLSGEDIPLAGRICAVLNNGRRKSGWHCNAAIGLSSSSRQDP